MFFNQKHLFFSKWKKQDPFKSSNQPIGQYNLIPAGTAIQGNVYIQIIHECLIDSTRNKMPGSSSFFYFLSPCL